MADMNAVRAILVACLLSAGCTASPTPLAGAWKSDRELTLAHLKPLEGISARQWDGLAAPDFFGELIQVHVPGHDSLIILNGKCRTGFGAHQVVDSGPDFVAVRHWDPFLEAHITSVFRVREGRLYVPIEALDPDALEVFVSISMDEVRQEYDCVDKYLADR